MEIFEEVTACLARAESYIGTHNASDAELAKIEELKQAKGSVSNGAILLLLIEIGELQRCPSSFWKEVRRAADLVVPLHSPMIDHAERAQRKAIHDRLNHVNG